jgi:Peptidase family S41
MRHAAAVALALVLVGCASSESSAPTTAATSDVDVLLDGLERVHPDPWHDVSAADFKLAADDLEKDYAELDPNGRLVELMRLLALLGNRDGHSGIFPLDPAHERELSLYPLRLYEFADGLFVVAAIGRPDLVGARVEAIAGMPVDDLRERVEPLVPRDNESSLAARLPQYMLVAEVLDGLGVTASPGPAEFTLVGRDGGRESLTLEPVPASAYGAAFPDLFHPLIPPGLPPRPEPQYLARRLDDRWLTTLAGGSVVYVAYNVTLGSTSDLAEQLRRLARRPGVESVVLDLRHNPGGNNTTYGPLLEELVAVDDLIVLIGRTTFSAAVNLLAELEQRGDPTLVGEPSGGSPNLYGDTVDIALPETGLLVQIATIYWELAAPDDLRVAFEPDVPVELTSRDFFAGRDPVLSAALRRAPR